MSAGRSAQLAAFGLEQIVGVVFGQFDAGRKPEIAGRLGARRPGDRTARLGGRYRMATGHFSGLAEMPLLAPFRSGSIGSQPTIQSKLSS